MNETVGFITIGALVSLAGDYLPTLWRMLAGATNWKVFIELARARIISKLSPRQRFVFYAALSFVLSASYAVGMALYYAKPATLQDIAQVFVNALVAWVGSQGAKNVWRILKTQQVIEHTWPDEIEY